MNTKISSVGLGGAYLKREPQGLSKVWRFVPGLLLAGVIALVATQLASLPWLKERGLGALTMAIVLGMLVGNTVYPRLAAQAAHGVTFSKQKLLRLGIILYGFHLTFQDIGQVGVAGVVIDALVLSSTFGLAMLLGTRVFGLDRKTTLLIGAGSSICGAAAVMATEPVVRGRAEQVTVAVSTVVVFGTVSMFLYPALYRWSVDAGVLPMTEHAFGVFAGSTIHEVAQAVAAGAAVSPQAADTAVIAKMVRVMMLAPFLLILSSWLQRNPEAGDPPKADISGGWLKRLNIPWFALGFIAVAGLNSLSILPPAVVNSALTLDALLLAMAMAALGLTTHASALKTAGVRPLLLATALFAWLLCGGLAINQIVPWLASWFA